MDTMLSEEKVRGTISTSVKQYQKYLKDRESLLDTRREEASILEVEVHRIRGAIAGYNELAKELFGDTEGSLIGELPEISSKVPDSLKGAPLFDDEKENKGEPVSASDSSESDS